MELLERAFEFIQEKTDEDILRDSVNVGTVWDTVDMYEVSGKPNDGSTYGGVQESVTVEKSEELYSVIDSTFNNVRSGLNVSKGVDVAPIVLKQTNDWGSMDYPFYSSGDADGQFFVGISQPSVDEEIKDELYEMVVDLLSEWDESVSRESLVNCEWFFSDMAIVELSSVSGTVQTKYPHRFYDVDSVEEFVETSNKDVTIDQDVYDIQYKCSVNSSNSLMTPIPSDMQDRVEEIMWNHIESTIDTSWEHRIEGEVIQFGENGEYKESEEFIKYYVYIPVFTGNRGF